MDRVNTVLFHQEYQECLRVIKEAETTREYCGHDLTHYLDVARLSWIDCLEHQLPYEQDVVYVMALMHDIGRALQYTEGIPHDQAGVMLTRKILPECGFSEQEVALIAEAIAGHRQSAPENGNKEGSEDTSSLNAILYKADHMSRNCFCCSAEESCYWPKEKKNLKIKR